MTYSSRPLINYPLTTIAAVLTEGFSGYFVPIHITEAALHQMVRQQSIDFSTSYMICAESHANEGKAENNEPVGVALVARRGWTSRLAAMSIVPEHRGQGAGTDVMAQLIADSKTRGDREIVLEVIEQNEPAVKLYQNVGFATVRRLVSYAQKTTAPLNSPHIPTHTSTLQEINMTDLARHLHQYGPADLPWQLSAETLATFSPPARAFELDHAWLALSDPSQAKIAIYSLFTPPDARNQGKARRIVEAAMKEFPQKEWAVPALCPEECGGFFEKMGFTRGEISQFQMSLIH